MAGRSNIWPQATVYRLNAAKSFPNQAPDLFPSISILPYDHQFERQIAANYSLHFVCDHSAWSRSARELHAFI